jgi:hypothetical protein
MQVATFVDTIFRGQHYLQVQGKLWPPKIREILASFSLVLRHSRDIREGASKLLHSPVVCRAGSPVSYSTIMKTPR